MSESDKKCDIRCRICMNMRAISEMQQILPCFHTFCHKCIAISTSFQSVLLLFFVIQNCAQIICRKLSQFETTYLNACKHEICTTCLEQSLQRRPPACIVEGCNKRVVEVEDTGFCYLCGTSVSDQYSINYKCKAKEDCNSIALNGFPSNSECSHDICMECLTEMICECEAMGIAPMCPVCHQCYTIESVKALRTLFPNKTEFFQKFDLDDGKMELLCKDESVTFVDLSTEFCFSARRQTIRVMTDSEYDTERILIFDKQGTIGDFIREIRNLLKIPVYEKIYGYFIKREDVLKDEEVDEEINISKDSLTKCITTLRLTPSCVIRVDTTGIVQNKSLTNL
ncbi:unnamed protein product [Thelazia callipaeda]|uniref:RING-type domain-containing protein n=1 Tax=Thelazia callipaeda TaxID=103827 RepID=A0A0N5D2T1_THECL|nr:unnamed protein product [Thelazia callipaeda]